MARSAPSSKHEGHDEIEAAILERKRADVRLAEFEPVALARVLDRLRVEIDSHDGLRAPSSDHLGAVSLARGGIQDTQAGREPGGKPVAGEVLGVHQLAALLVRKQALSGDVEHRARS